MARTHVIVAGTLGLAAAAPLSEHLLHRPMGAGTLLAFSGVCAGYGILPDLDHPQATLARTLGPATKALSRAVNKLSGGHRKGTHTVWFAALTVGAVWLASWRFGARADLPVAWVGFYLAAMALKLARKPTTGAAELAYAAEAAAATAACYWLPGGWWWLPYAVGAGVVGHILADILTVEGVPILYPLLPGLMVRAPLLGRTDSAREHGMALLLAPAAAYIVLAILTGNAWWDIGWAAHPGSWTLSV